MLKEFAEETKQKMNKDLELYETTFFLFYSDLDKREAKNWAGVLDRMYGMLADLFAIDRKTNIWRGKALVFVFREAADYRRFQIAMHDTDPGTTLGMSHGFGDGMVHIAFFRQKEELDFLHLLVHESVHGFVHRYKTPARVPSWANEGLAEWISNQFVAEQEKRLFGQTRREKKSRYNAQYLPQGISRRRRSLRNRAHRRLAVPRRRDAHDVHDLREQKGLRCIHQRDQGRPAVGRIPEDALQSAARQDHPRVRKMARSEARKPAINQELKCPTILHQRSSHSRFWPSSPVAAPRSRRDIAGARFELESPENGHVPHQGKRNPARHSA